MSLLQSMILTIFKAYRKGYSRLLAALIIAGIATLLSQCHFVEDVELKTVDLRFQLLAHDRIADSSIVLVAIDQNSLDFFKHEGIGWPLPRDLYKYALEYFAEGQAKAVLFDIIFDDPDYFSEELYADAFFAEGIRTHGKVILGSQLRLDSTETAPQLNKFALPLVNNHKLRDAFPLYQNIVAPLPLLCEAAHNIGILDVKPDRDGIVRRVPLFHRYRDIVLPQFAFAAWYDLATNSMEIVDKGLQMPDELIPLDREGNFFIYWYGKGGPEGTFPYRTFSSIITSAAALQMGYQPQISPDYFRDKYVIIGATAAGLKDLRPTPFTSKGDFPGMEIWATVLSNLLNHHFIRLLATQWVLSIAFGLALLTIGCFFQFTILRSHVVLLVVLVGVVAGVGWAWQSALCWVPLMPLFIAFLLAYLYSAVASYLIEGKSKQKLRNTFNRYLHPDVIHTLIESESEDVELGGKEVLATVLFSDIYNFTTFSENTEPKQLVEYLNNYFDHLTHYILENDGLLDKYTGDGIMAIFGVPMVRCDHAFLACRAALQHRAYAQQIENVDIPVEVKNFHYGTRIGINSGPIVAGNIGSQYRMDYTAIGDGVNLAARLEGVNKIFGTHIIISEATFQLVSDHFICRELDFLTVKGRTRPTRIYELLAEKGKGVDNFDWVEHYQKALTDYRNGEFRVAMEQFKQLAIGPRKDKPARMMWERCEYLLLNPPQNWTGIMKLEVK